MESPIKRRQLVRGGVDLDLYAAAGKTPNILGEAIGGIGTVLGEAYDKAKKKSDAINKEEEDLLSAITETEEETPFDPNSVETESEFSTPEEDLDDILNKTSVTNPTQGNTYTYDMLGADAKAEFLKKNPGQFAAAEAHANKTVQEAKAYNVKKYGTEDPTKNVAGVNNIVKAKKVDGQYEAGSAEGKPVVEGSTTFGSKGVINPSLYSATKRLTNSPLDRRRIRRQLSQPTRSSLANVFGGPSQTSYLVGSRSVPSDAISRGEVSQYTPGRTFIEKERRLSAPAWMGIGAAAIEGYNMGVEKRNYEKQVQADLADYYANEFSGLTAERTGNDLFDNSVKALLFDNKKELATHLAKREEMFAEGKGPEWSAMLSDLKKPANEVISLVEGVKGYMDQFKKDNEDDSIDYSAMPTTQVDEMLSVVRGGNIGVANVEGMGTSLIGETRGGMPYLKSLAAVISEGKGPKYIKKKNAFDFVNSAVDMIRKDPDKYSTTFEDSNGVKVKKPMTLEQLAPYLNRMFDAELDSPAVTRAYASPNNWDEDGLTADQFDLSVKAGQDPKDFVKELVSEAISKLSDKNLNKLQKEAFVEEVALENVDINALGLYTLGELRKSASESDISDYQKSFEKYFLKSLTSRLTDYSESEFEVLGEDKKSSNYTIVNSKVSPTDGGPEIKIDWRIYTKNPDKPLIRDLIVEGLSLARTQKEEFASILSSNNNDIKILISKLQEFVKK